MGLGKRLDKMLASGRITEAEADSVRAAATPDEREAAARAIQLRHARARVDDAVAEGGVSPEDAAVLRARLESGEAPGFLRGLRGRRGRADQAG